MRWRLMKTLLVLVASFIFVSNMVFIMNSTEESKCMTQHESGKLAGFEKAVAGSKFIESYPYGESQSGHRYLRGALLDIQVISSRRNVTVTVNGKKVAIIDKDTNTGINVVVLNQASGAVMATRSFDTYLEKEESSALINFVNSLNEGRILCFAVKDEASYALTNEARRFLQGYGSSFIGRLKWRDMWSMVVQRVGSDPILHSEGYQGSPPNEEWAFPVTLHTRIKAQLDNSLQCANGGDTELYHRWREFCAKYDGYENLCKCTHISITSIEMSPPSLSNGGKVKLPVAVMASNRPTYLYRMLRTLQKVHGLVPSMVTVYIEGLQNEPAAIARLFGLRLEQHKPVGQGRARIHQHYKRSLTSAFNQHPDAKYLVILEEDLDIAPDILDYFSQVLPVMENDKSLYCVSAWNDQSYVHSSGDASMLYRIDGMPGLGWVLSRRLYKDELEAQWPTPEDQFDWDIWMRSPGIRKGRECVIPDVSRTFHFGAKGLNINPYMQKLYFTERAFNTKINVTFITNLLYASNYEKEITRLIRSSILLDHSKSPCTHRDFIPDTRNQNYLFYIWMSDEGDWKTWLNIASCFHIWDYDPRGFHKGMWRFWMKGNHILVVGYPASPYSQYKSKEVKPLVVTKGKQKTPPEWYMRT